MLKLWLIHSSLEVIVKKSSWHQLDMLFIYSESNLTYKNCPIFKIMYLTLIGFHHHSYFFQADTLPFQYKFLWNFILKLNFSEIRIKLVNQFLRNKKKIKVNYWSEWQTVWHGSHCCFRSTPQMPKLWVI